MSIPYNTDSKSEMSKQKQSFIVTVASLPEPLKKKFLGTMAAAIMVAVLILAMVFGTKDIKVFAGMLIPLYVAFLGMDIVWAYQKGTLICQRMVCIKTNKHPLFRDCIEVLCQEINGDKPMEDRIHQFFVSGSKKNRVTFTEKTILDIYYKPNTPAEITAWSVLGYLTIT